MINLESEFSPRVNPADANYPFGSIKDNSSSGANDGTPLAAVWGNDWEGFAQAAMTEAGITPSGLPDTAQDSQLLDAVKAVTSGALRGEILSPGGDGIIGHFTSVSEMASSADLVAGGRYITLGYHTPSDGGQGVYLISTTATHDGAVDIQCAGGVVAVLQHDGTVLSKQCGAVDGESDQNHVRLRTLCTKPGVSKVQFNGMHSVDKCVLVGSNKTLWSPLRRCKNGYGISVSSAFLADASTNTLDNACLLATEKYAEEGNAAYLSNENITVSGITFIYNDAYDYATDTRVPYFNHIVVNNCTKFYVGGCYAVGGKNHFLEGVTLNDFHVFDNEIKKMGFSPIQINSGSGGLLGQGVASYTVQCKDGKIFDNHISGVQAPDIRPAIHLHVQSCQDIEIYRNVIRSVKYGIGSDFVFNVKNAYTGEVIVPSDNFALGEDTNIRIYSNDVVADVIGIALCRGGSLNSIHHNTVKARVGIATSSNLASGLSTDICHNTLSLCEVPIDACCVSGSAANICENKIISELTINNGRIQIRGGSSNAFNNSIRGGGGIIYRDFVEVAAFNGLTKTNLLAENAHGGNNMILASGGKMIDYLTSLTNYSSMCHDFGNVSANRIADTELDTIVTPRGIEYMRGAQRQMTAWANATNTAISDYTKGKAKKIDVYWSSADLANADDLGTPLIMDAANDRGVFVTYNSSTGKWVARVGANGFGYTPAGDGAAPVLRTTGYYKIVFSH